MKIHTILSPALTDELHYTGKIVVVIDVLRATSTIVTAVENGAREIVPVSSLEFGQKASHNIFGGKTIRGGEKNMEKIEGFDLGNSPREYTHETVADKSIIMFTTNGSKAIVKTKFAEQSLVGSYLNITALVEYLVSMNRDFEILCAGNANGFSMEDTACAGKIISLVQKAKPDTVLTDPSKAALLCSNESGDDLLAFLQNTDHGKLMISKNFGADIEECAKMGIYKAIPILKQNTIKNLSLN